MRRLSIVIDARMLNYTGIGTYLRNIVPFLNEEFRLILLGSADEIMKFDWSAKVDVIENHTGIYSIREQLNLPIRIPKCDILWSPNYNIPILPTRSRKRVVTIHDVFHLTNLKSLTLPQKAYAAAMFNLSARISDKVITVSDYSRTEILKYLRISQERVDVVHNGVDTTAFTPEVDRSLAEEVRRKYRMPDRYILFVGNMKQNKNLKNLLLAFLQLTGRNEFNDTKLVLVGKREGFITGDKDLADLLETEHQLNTNLVITGRVLDEELPYFYNRALLFVFPSFYEGFGFPPLEAMASGCPVVVSRIPPLREVCGGAAHFVNPYDINDIAEGIARVIGDPALRDRMIAAGLDRARELSWEKSAEKTAKIFREMSS